MFKLSESSDKFRIFGTARSESFFANPSLSSEGDVSPYEFGIRFKPTVTGHILALKYWKAPGENIIHVGRVWSDTGTLLAHLTFTQETSGGWQQQYLANPLPIIANTYYRVSVNCSMGYAYVAQGFGSSITKGNLFAPISAGVFANGEGNFPNSVFNNNNYYRDLIFIAS